VKQERPSISYGTKLLAERRKKSTAGSSFMSSAYQMPSRKHNF